MNEEKDYDWLEAERRIQDAMAMYQNVPLAAHNSKKMSKLHELSGKLMAGKRDARTYEEIMKITGG